MTAKERLQRFREPIDLDKAAEERSAFRRWDRALIGSSDDGSPPPSVAVRGTGEIELFTGNGIGVRIHPGLESITFFAPRMQIYVDELDIQTRPLGLRWNQFPLNLKPMFTGASPAGPVTTEGSLLPYSHLPEAIAKAVERMGRLVI